MKNDTISTELPAVGYVRLKQILAIIPVGKSTWWAGIKKGQFPEPIKLGPRTTAWRVEDIRAFIQSHDREVSMNRKKGTDSLK
jgi:prophage regulatory protein